MTLAHALTPLPHTGAWVPSPTGFVVELPLARLWFPQRNLFNISDGGVVLGDIPSAFSDPIVRGGESPLLLLPLAFVLCPKGGGGGGTQPWGQHSPDRMLGKYLVSAREGDVEEGWGWPTQGSRFCCSFFFFSPPFLIFLAVGPSS